MTSHPNLDQLNPEELRALAAQLIQRVETMDKQITHHKFGKNALHSGRMPIDAAWAMKCELMSKSYTTSIGQHMKFQAV